MTAAGMAAAGAALPLGAASTAARAAEGNPRQTYTMGTRKLGGLEVSEARRLKTLEDENARLKKLLAGAMLDNAILKDVAAKKR